MREWREGDAVTSAINALMLLCLDGFMTGRWAEAHKLAGEGIELCEAHGYRLLTWPLQLTLALLAAARGDDTSLLAITGGDDPVGDPERGRARFAQLC